MLCSKGSGGGYVARSTNYGATWTAVWGPGTLTSYGMPLQIDDNNPAVYYLAPDNAYVLRSTDYGVTFNTWGTKIFRSPCDVAVEFGNSNIMWVADGITGSGVGDFWKSTDNGKTWSQAIRITNGSTDIYRARIVASGSYVHVAGQGNLSNGFYAYFRSQDGGKTWVAPKILVDSLGPYGGGQAIASDNNLVHGTYTKVEEGVGGGHQYYMHSTDNGVT